MNMIDVVEKESRKENVTQFKVGDLVDVHVKTIEGDKERIQIFSGMVIRRKGSGTRETFTVRRVVQGEGVERIFPVHSPNVTEVVVKKSHKTRRAKLYYLRDRKGKSARLKEVRRRIKKTDSVEETVPVVVTDEPAETTKVTKAAKAAKAPKAKAKAKKKDEE
jgi:large subunit ribosomal protein L19